MVQSLLFALGAGLGSGLLFILPVKGSVLGMWLSMLAPLPLMIVAMGFGARFGLLTAMIAAAVCAFFQPALALAFLLSSAIPALILAAVTRRVFIVEDPLAPGTLLATICAIAIVAVFGMIGVATFTYGSFDVAARDITELVKDALKGMKGFDEPSDIAEIVVSSIPAIMAFWSVLAMALNLFFAMKVVRISGLFHGALPDIPSSTVLPQAALVAFALALFVCIAPGLPRLLGSVAAVAIGTAFMLQGLASLHRITRDRPMRGGLLGLLYGLILILFPLPLFVLAGVGVAEQLRLLARPKLPPTNTNDQL
jgi:hypothetical protein